ncbi:aminopeptidase P family protein [Alphaproteobacteria bacterium]|nr:aminopeptidase P family protein [Alphaproteobacteria bacterium]
MKNLKIAKIQQKLKDKKIDSLIINRTDEFLNEYIPADAERLYWATNFSGSAGRAIICQNSSNLFVDGRYTFQAKAQIDENAISLLHWNDFSTEISKHFEKNKCVALDPMLHSIEEMNKIVELAKEKETKLHFTSPNLIDELWTDKPKRKYSVIFNHPINYAGIDASNKIDQFVKELKHNNLDSYFLSSLDSIAWLLNIRADDILHTPLAFSYLFISVKNKPILYLSIEKLNTDLKDRLSNFLNLQPIVEIENIFKHLTTKLKVGFDYKNTSYFFYDLALGNDLVPSHLQNPCLIPKATKNETEIEGSRKAHLRDGASITKFLYWLKNHQSVEEENEISVANKLLSFRESNELFHSVSFDSISAIGKNAALPHYRADKNNPVSLKNNCIYLSDSGGQYYDGTTDITRTIILGNPNKEQIDRFTRVLKGHINLSSHTFKKGTKGTDIDYLARESLQEINCDYDHGTGHGIGSFLSVHEAPQRISKKSMFPSVELLPGMILSNEPGYYKEGEYGIRIENIIVVKEDKENLLKFENISWAPIDKDLIDPNMLNSRELNWINNYHKMVFEKLSIFLTLEEKNWLQNVTKPL